MLEEFFCLETIATTPRASGCLAQSDGSIISIPSYAYIYTWLYYN
jgi:hypothetical protein